MGNSVVFNNVFEGLNIFKKYVAKIRLPGNGIRVLFIPQSSTEFWHVLPLVIGTNAAAVDCSLQLGISAQAMVYGYSKTFEASITGQNMHSPPPLSSS